MRASAKRFPLMRQEALDTDDNIEDKVQDSADKLKDQISVDEFVRE